MMKIDKQFKPALSRVIVLIPLPEQPSHKETGFFYFKDANQLD